MALPVSVQNVYQIIRKIQSLQTPEVVQREGSRVQSGDQVSLQPQAEQSICACKPTSLDLHTSKRSTLLP